MKIGTKIKDKVRARMFILCIILIPVFMTSCAKSQNAGKDANGADKISVVASIFPEYDWVKQIAEGTDRIDLSLLISNGVDLHSYQPTAKDIINISDCDIFIYVGGESDKWISDALAQTGNKEMTVIKLMDIIGDSAKKEEIREGMEAEDQGDEAEYDEHVWLSLKNARIFCETIAEALCSADSENTARYKANLKNYTEKLNNLDVRYQTAADTAQMKTLVFADRFPFRYMTDDYGIEYYAAFNGCSAETEASFKTIKFLADKIDELGLKTVLTIDNPQHKIADAVIKNTRHKNQTVLVLDSMQSVTEKDISNGASYLNAAEKNLQVLKQALNEN